jgi:ferrochelatase
VSPTSVPKQPADGVPVDPAERDFEALLVVSFGGPEGMDDVIPFLENVTRGRNIPRERLEEVAHHYERFGGVSPINQQNRDLIAALAREFERSGIELPIFFGNRNWDPYLTDALAEMRAAGVRRALGFFTSAFSSYSGCRQYRENIFAAQLPLGEDAPEIFKLRTFYNHPGFVEANVARVRTALERVAPARRGSVPIVFTAHSIPTAMAEQCRYESQLAETAALVAAAVGGPPYAVVYQSRSGSPQVPWLGPDVGEHLRALRAEGVTEAVVSPVGFVSDHLEVLFDLDVEAVELGQEIGLEVLRAGTAGTHPAFVGMIRELVQERLEGAPKRTVGRFGPSPDVCPNNCCLPGNGKPSPWDAAAASV